MTRDTSPSKRGLLRSAVLPPISAQRPFFLTASKPHVELAMGRRPRRASKTRVNRSQGGCGGETHWEGGGKGCRRVHAARPSEIPADLKLAMVGGGANNWTSGSAAQNLALSCARPARGRRWGKGISIVYLKVLLLFQHWGWVSMSNELVRSQKIMRRLFPWKLGGTDAADCVRLHFKHIGKRNNRVLSDFSPREQQSRIYGGNLGAVRSQICWHLNDLS